MLIRFRFSNFRSFRDEAELSMVAAHPKGRSDTVHVDGLDVDLVRVAGAYGANASGKSNLLSALQFLRSAVLSSFQHWHSSEPVRLEPFVLSPQARSEGSTFEVELVLEGIPLHYGARFKADRVLGEWLYSFPRGRRRVWFERDAEGQPQFSFGKTLTGPNHAIAAITRGDGLFLTAAGASDHRQLLPLYRWFVERLGFASGSPCDGLQALEWGDFEDAGKRALLLHLVRAADLGIVDVTPEPHGPRPRGDEVRDGGAIPALLGEALLGTESRWPEGRSREVWFHHGAGARAYRLPERAESKGTRTLVHLAVRLIQALEKGAFLCVDELDSSLHPHLVREIVSLFSDPVRNSKGAQLLFNTHDTSLLGQVNGPSPLHRDQVWLVERDPEGASRLYPLTDFRARKDENLERGYLQGRYGAVPFLEPLLRE